MSPAELHRPLLLIQLATTLPLCGLIWLIQLVHYPLLAEVGTESFPGYHASHSARISLIVVPLMLLELASAGLLLTMRPPGLPIWQAASGMALVTLVWGSTFFLQVPMHSRLAGGFDQAAWASLVTGNWFRTFGWTLRGGLVLWWTRFL
ncbi:MAG: hypothetical protein ACJAYU_004361 [Bradymonadia bacterium]|jgi:hypothetical protein